MEQWMTDLPSHLRALPLGELVLPGAHNAFSYCLSDASCIDGVAADAPVLLRSLLANSHTGASRLLSIVQRWSVCQSLGVGQQLSVGVRYLDARLQYCSACQQLHVVHALLGPARLPQLLFEVLGFLQQHPGEFVLLDFQHLYGASREVLARLSSLLFNVFGSMLVPRQGCGSNNPAQLRLDKCTESGWQVLCLYRGHGAGNFLNFFEVHPYLWPAVEAVRSHWPNTQSASRLLRHMEASLRVATLERHRLHVAQFILTPQCRRLVSRLGRGSLASLAAACNSRLPAWLDKHSVDTGLNIVMIDFVSRALCCLIVVKNYR